MSDASRKMRVLCPVARGDKTFWCRCGSAFTNQDNSINIYLDVLPTNGKLQLREWDERPYNAPGRPAPDQTAPARSAEPELPF